MAGAQKIEISINSILKILVVVLAVVFLYTIRDVLLIVFVALVLAAAIDPSITSLERRGVPRAFGIAVIYIGLLAVLSLIFVLLVPLVTSQIQQLTVAFPQLYAKAFSLFQNVKDQSVLNSIQQGLDSLNAASAQITKGFFSGLIGFFGGIFSLIGVFVLTFYLTMEEKGMKRLAMDLAPAKYRPYLTQLFHRMEERLGAWLRGQLTLGLIIAVMTYIGLTLLGVKYALVLALLAGVTELVPIIGPLIGAVPAIIVALSQQPVLALWTALLYFGIQQLENHLIVPRVMSKATGLSPIIVIISLLVAAKISGITGIILAIPTVIIITTFLEDFLEEKKAEDGRLETT